MAISMLKIRRPLGRLIFNMGIAIPDKTVFLIETAPSVFSKLWQYIRTSVPMVLNIYNKHYLRGLLTVDVSKWWWLSGNKSRIMLWKRTAYQSHQLARKIIPFKCVHIRSRKHMYFKCCAKYYGSSPKRQVICLSIWIVRYLAGFQ